MAEQKKTPKRKRRLGRGLSSLMNQPVRVSPEIALDDSSRSVSKKPNTLSPGMVQQDQDVLVQSEQAVVVEARDGETPLPGDSIRLLTLTSIHPNPNQPRAEMDPERLRALAGSIRDSGVMQPILVRPASLSGVASSKGADVGEYEIVAGERRWRAAGLAELEQIPALVREIDDRASAEWALIENIQREDLNAIEKAEAFLNLVEEFGLTQSQVAERVGLERSSVANLLRLNHLDSLTKDDVRADRLQLGHAKVLLSMPDEAGVRRKLAEATILGGWSVRELERRVASLLKRGEAGASDQQPSGHRQHGAKPEHIRTLEHELGELLGMQAEIKLGRSKKSGKVTIAFKDVGEFEGLLERMRKACG